MVPTGASMAQTLAPTSLLPPGPQPVQSAAPLADVTAPQLAPATGLFHSTAQQAGPAGSLPMSPGPCHIRGVIRTPAGDAIAGARVQLHVPGGATQQERVTDAGGAYTLDGLAPGNYILLVTADGFLPAAYPIRLPDEGGTALVDVTPKVGAEVVSVDVTASQEDIAEAELAVQEQQRMAGILPNFYVSYQWEAARLSTRQKYRLALKNATDPGNLVLVGATAGVQQALGTFPGYSQGAKGYGRRFGADLGNLVAGTFLGGAVLPSLFHQDPRYFYRGTGSVKSRLWYAVTRAVVTRSDAGKPQPNWSGMLGDLSAGALSNVYYAPEDRRGVRLTLVNGVLGIGGDALNGFFQEFVLRRLTTTTEGRHGKASVVRHTAPATAKPE